ncbi:EamA family transporter RarD [Pseudomonas sp. HMWF021]|uniref:EamA family transporter RarD n=1 Tax=Pseudomonas sp. HMWF021 TaxID=2056857 RepID=UPI000D349791|nr:EamA family transporter RarD [Pseudomonas sp. HMWF021]PTT29508.1 EamA family transporter RarD [Pseudomonas sp. HMWF021]
MFKGVALSITSSCLFATLYYYATLLSPLNGEEIFGWRMLLMLPCITAFLIISGEWCQVKAVWQRLSQKPQLLIGLCLSSALLGTQQWLFMWAPLNGHGLDVSLGYFLLPLVMLMLGKVVYGDQLTSIQKIAALCAGLGALNELYQVGKISWSTLLVAFGFPLYFMLRRKLSTASLGGLWFDILLTLPVAAYFALGDRSTPGVFTQVTNLYLLLALLAVISSAAFMSYTVAGKHLPFSLFGLLGYVEPILMVAVALILGEQIKAEQWLTYMPIWTAVGLLVLDGGRYLRATRLLASEQNSAKVKVDLCDFV